MSKVKIDRVGWEKFTGKLQRIPFTNGVSDRELTNIEKRRLGANIRIVDLGTHAQVGSATEVGMYNDVSARVLVDLPRGKDEKEPEVLAEVKAEKEKSVEAPVVEEKAKVYTREELEVIADKSGIKGVRKVAAEFGVKGVQISEIIDEILEAQKEA